MLQTCNRCQTRRIKCDALLPSCANCAKVSFPCSFKDKILQENIPRSYIASLYDRINELNSVLSVQKHQSAENSSGIENNVAILENQGQTFHILPSKSGENLYLGPSPPALIAFTAVRALLNIDIQTELPTTLTASEETLGPAEYRKLDRSLLTPSVIRVLLAHYDRAIRPEYPITGLSFATQADCPLKSLSLLDKFKVVICCGTAAIHKSYTYPSWRTLGSICREWADDLSIEIIEKHDAHSVEALVLLLIYELADPERCIVWDLLNFVVRICLELGWHRISRLDRESGSSYTLRRHDIQGEEKSQLMLTLHSIERPLQIIFQRPSVLNSKFPIKLQDDAVFDAHILISSTLFGPRSSGVVCPASESVLLLTTKLNQLPKHDLLVHESWIMFLPTCLEHPTCEGCSSGLERSTNVTTILGLRAQVLESAKTLLVSAHRSVISRDSFLPPQIASSRAFAAGCVLVTAITGRWDGAQDNLGFLLQCSEVLAFFGPLWKGGNDFYEVWRKIVVTI